MKRMRGASKPSSVACSILLASILGSQCIVATVSAVSHQIPSSEYLTQARRCVELGDCPSRGGLSGFQSLFHGAAWIRLLVYSLRAGTDQTPIQSFVLGTMLFSIPITFGLFLRYLGMWAATLALGLYFQTFLVPSDITVFTYANLLPLPMALYYTALCLFVEFRRTVFAAIGSICLAVAVSLELASIIMLPFHVLVVALLAPRKALAVAVTIVSFAIPYAAESTDAAWAIAGQIPTIRFAIGVAVSAVVVAFVTRIGRDFLSASRSPGDRVRAVMIAALLYTAGSIWLASVTVMVGNPSARYFLPAFFPFLYVVAEALGTLGTRATVLLVALESLTLLLLSVAPYWLWVYQESVVAVVTLYALAAALRRRSWTGGSHMAAPALWSGVALCAGAIVVATGEIIVLAERGTAQAFTLGEAEQLVRKIYAAGYTYPQILASLQGPAADDLLSLLTERDPKAFTEPPARLPDAEFSLLVVTVPNAVIGATQGMIGAVATGRSRSTIIVRGEASYVRWRDLRRCSWSGQSTTYRCVAPETDQSIPHNWPFVEFSDAPPWPDDQRIPRVSDRKVHFEVPVHTPGHGSPHVMRVTNEWPLTWRIARITGVDFEGTLPGPEVRLLDRREAAGRIELEFSPGDPPWLWLPHVLEVAADNDHLLEPLRGGREN